MSPTTTVAYNVKRKPLPRKADPLCFDMSSSPAGSHKLNGTEVVYDSNVQSEEYGSGQHVARNSSPPKWTPFHLQRPVLLVFTLIYFCCSVTIAVLFAYSEIHQGLSVVDKKYYYLWTYGPVAALTSIAAFWKQVVYRTKQLAPWQLMTEGSQLASMSVLLDYISSFNICVPFTAVKNRHYLVGLVAFSDLMLTALIVSATGLFTVQDVDVTKTNVSLTISSNFDLSRFNSSVVDSRPSALSYAVRNLGLAYPVGTTAQYAVQAFSQSKSVNGTITTEVDAFSAGLDCEPVESYDVSFVDYMAPQQYSLPGVAVKVATVSKNCSVDVVVWIKYAAGANNSWGMAGMTDCGSGVPQRIFVSTGRFGQSHPANASSMSSASRPIFEVLGSKHMVCIPWYQVVPSSVRKRIAVSENTNIKQSEQIEQVVSLKSHIVYGESAVAIAEGVTQSALGFNPLPGTGYPDSADAFFGMAISGLQFPDELAASEYWLQYNNLDRAFAGAYQSIAAQLAAQYLLVLTNTSSSGSNIVSESRLYVRLLSFILMQVGLVTLLLVAAILVFFVPRSMLPCDPGSISGVNVVLALSPGFARILDRTKADGRPLKTKYLCQYKYSYGSNSKLPGLCVAKVMIDNTRHPSLTKCFVFRVLATFRLLFKRGTYSPVQQERSITAKVEAEAESTEMAKDWWRPFVLRPLPYVLTTILPILYIVVLQLLLTYSNSYEGLVQSPTNQWAHYYWTYIPAILMTCLGLLYKSVNFNLLVLSPYARMKRGGAATANAVTDHPLSRITLANLCVSASSLEIAVFATTLAVLLVPVLTIAVAGLYFKDSFDQLLGVRQLTAWYFDDVNSQRGSSALASLFNKTNLTGASVMTFDSARVDTIVFTNLSYPRWTYEELVLPFIEVTNTGRDGQVASQIPTGSLKVSLPSIRGGLNCTLISQDNVVVTYDMFNRSLYPTDSGKTTWPRMRYQGNRPCLNWTRIDLATGITPQGDEKCRITVFNLSTNYMHSSCRLDPQIVFLPTDDNMQHTFGYFATAGDPLAPYCPLHTGVFGSLRAGKIEEFSWFVCSSSFSKVDANVELALPEYSITSATPNEDAVTPLYSNFPVTISQNLNVGSTLHFKGHYSAAAPVQFSPLNFDANELLTFSDTSDNQNYDNFVFALVHGRDDKPFGSFLGKESAPKLFSAVEHLWRIILAQGISIFMSADPEDITKFAPTGEWNFFGFDCGPS